MASGQNREELDARARHGETVVPDGSGGKSLEAQEHLAEGRSRGGQTRRDQLGPPRGRDQKRADWNRRVQGNGPKRQAQHNGQVRRRAGGRGRDRDRRVQVSDQESVAADHHVLTS